MARGRKNIAETEIGNTGIGLKAVSGKKEENLSELWKGKKKKEFITEMRLNDSYVNAWINSKNAIALKPDWGVQPKNPEDEKSKEYANLISDMLFKDMATSFNSFILNSITMAEYGFSVSEIVLKKRLGKTDNPMTSSLYNDGLFGIAKLSPRWQNSITKWDIDNNGNPEGESVLRGTFVSYYNKKNIERIQRETFERGFTGVLDIAVPPRYLSKKYNTQEGAEVIRAIEAFMRNVKQGKEAGIVRPYSKDFEIQLIQGKTGTGLDPDKMIDRYNTEIVLCLLSDSFMGQSKVYQSKDGSGTKTKLYKSFIGIILDEIKEQVNRKLIPLIFEVNNLDFDQMPYLDYGNLDDLDLQAVSWFIQSVAKNAGPLITPTYELNNYLLDKLVGRMAPKPTREEYEKGQMRNEIQTINNLNYEALQNPEYLDSDSKSNNDLEVADINTLEEENSTAQNSSKVNKKPRGNYGGSMKGGT